jgi:type 1 fimbriae regulatory protein FimB/type 1 fimbriae regulatory protein FimE
LGSVYGTVRYAGCRRNKALSTAKRRAPTIIYGTLPPRRRDIDVRPREVLTTEEVRRLRRAAGDRDGRHGHRDATLVLLAYRHGLRASELVALRWDMVDLQQGLGVTRS